jgi:oligopeptide transport system substrate-binding protein
MLNRRKKHERDSFTAIGLFLFGASFCVFLSACAEIQKPAPEPFYAETTPPAKQEFRWSNGKAVKSFDPAQAAAAPETDIVRALFEGLTDIDSHTLKEKPAAAERWTSSPDLRVWTFQLRKDARWSNGKRVNANDFVRSWKRLANLRDKVAHRDLFQNVIGLQTGKSETLSVSEIVDFSHSSLFGEEVAPSNEQSNSVSIVKPPSEIANPPANTALTPKKENKVAVTQSENDKLGVEAIDETTLRVTLEMPDKDFPKLVANPIFRPVYGNGDKFETAPLDADVVTNGPFTVASVGKDNVILDRSDSYWNRSGVSLEQVKFVFKESAEAALSAYKKGEIDALTNAEFEPLALKILSPYDDFRQTTHSALNFYEFNTKNIPFNDRRVREALAISIDRDRITEGELERTALPATSFLPLSEKGNGQLFFDAQKARKLLGDAGFVAGAGFPKIRLLVNRNDTQQRVARAVAKMWKQNLNLDTEIFVKELSEMDEARSAGEYDLVRRGVVIPALDEAVSMTTIFGEMKQIEQIINTGEKSFGKHQTEYEPSSERKLRKKNTTESSVTAYLETDLVPKTIVSEVDAISELRAIPLYFPMAYSLIKPYVLGFEVNGIDAISFDEISIDSSWRPKAPKGES